MAFYVLISRVSLISLIFSHCFVFLNYPRSIIHLWLLWVYGRMKYALNLYLPWKSLQKTKKSQQNTHKTTQKQPNNSKTNKQAKKKNQQNKKTEMSIKEDTNQMIIQRPTYFGNWGCMLTYHTYDHMTYMFLTNSICERPPQFLDMKTVAHCFSKNIVWQGRQWAVRKN